MFLASIEGNLLGLIIFAVIGVVNWLAQKKQEADEKRPKPPPREVPASERPSGGASDEEERLRKFMEALGLPPNTPPPRRTEPKRPPFVSRPAEPPPTARIERPRRELPRAPQRAFPKATPPPLPARRKRSLDEADAPVAPVEALSLPPLETRTVPEFDTVASHISAIPHEMAAARAANDAYQERAPATVAVENPLADLLRSRDDLRRAILLREVLGPPRGLEDREPLQR